MKRATRGARNIFEYQCVPIKAQIIVKTRFAFQIILFQKTLEFKHTIALWKITITSTLRPCVKSTSLGNSPNCCKYFESDGSTMCVELKSMLLVFF
jgi:hypothetical protein